MSRREPLKVNERSPRTSKNLRDCDNVNPYTMQPTLFESPASASTVSDRFAEIVFDRPLDHAYTYAAPEHLRDLLAVGKRVLAPFGRGDRQTIGFCVGLTST